MMFMQFSNDRSGPLVLAPPAPRALAAKYALAPQPDADPTAAALLGRFEAIDLASMDAVALQNRIDTKYVFRAQDLYAALGALSEQYRVLDIGGVRQHPYRTVYFDTADMALYRRHHDERPLRYKVRSRHYVATRQSFFEVKQKGHNDRTQKQRLATPHLATALSDETRAFLGAHAPIDADELAPRLWNDFSRITLVHRQQQERLTLDLCLQFGCGPRGASLSGLAIAELKQGAISRSSPFLQQMRALRIRPTGFSKYCVGVALLYPHVKHNNFKPQLQLVQALLRRNNDAR